MGKWIEPSASGGQELITESSRRERIATWFSPRQVDGSWSVMEGNSGEDSSSTNTVVQVWRRGDSAVGDGRGGASFYRANDGEERVLVM
jgi:hypothetical protein